MNDENLGHAWSALEPGPRTGRRIDARVFAWLEAQETPLVAEWLYLFRVAPVAALGFTTVSALSFIGVTPLIWLVRALA